MASTLDFSLYVITDPEASGGRMQTEVVRLALEGGATAIQYRDKQASVLNQLHVGTQLRELTRRHGAAFIVNDRPDLALALDADAVQTGPFDLPPQVVRKIVGPNIAIGVSVGDVSEAREAEAAGADYIIARPVFPTRWSPDRRPTMGVEGLRAIVQAVKLPVIASGGVNVQNLKQVFEAGAAGPAVTAAIAAAPDPLDTARQLRQLLDTYRQRK